MMHNWQTRPAEHLNSYVCCRAAFHLPFFLKWCFSCESQLWRDSMKQQQSPWGWQWHYSLSPPLSSPEAKQNTCSIQSLQQIFPFPRALSYTKLSSSYSYQASLADSLPHRYTSHTCSNSWYQPPTNLLPICLLRQLLAFLFHTYGHALNPTLTLHLQVELITGWHFDICQSATCLHEFEKVSHVEPHKT